LVVDLAENGKEGIRKLEESDYDAVLTDVQMTEMNGLEATQYIRTELKKDKLPIIGVTAYALKGDKEKCLESGMSDYVTKPLDVRQLFTVLEKWIPSKKRVDGKLIPERMNPKNKVNQRPIKNIPGIDARMFLEKTGTDLHFLKKVLKQFEQENRDVSKNVRDALDRKDFEAAHQLIHTVKGVAGNINAEKLHIAAKELEGKMRERETDTLDSYLDHFEEELELVLDTCRNFVGSEETSQTGSKKKSENKVPFDPSRVIPLLKELNALLLKNSLEAEDCLASVKDCLSGSRYQKEIESVEDHLDLFDFKGARSSLSFNFRILSPSSFCWSRHNFSSNWFFTLAFTMVGLMGFVM